MPSSYTNPARFTIGFIVKASGWSSNNLEISRLAPHANVLVSHDGGGTWEPATQFSVLRAGDQLKVGAATDTKEMVVLNDHNYRLVVLQSETTIEIDEHGWSLQKGEFYLKDIPGREPIPNPPPSPSITFSQGSHAFDLSVLGAQSDLKSQAAPALQAAAATQPVEFECDLTDTGPGTISVYRGEVMVKSSAGGFAQTVLRAGEKAVFTPSSIEVNPAPASFADVSPSHPYAAAIIGLEMAGIVSGKTQGRRARLRSLRSGAADAVREDRGRPFHHDLPGTQFGHFLSVGSLW